MSGVSRRINPGPTRTNPQPNTPENGINLSMRLALIRHGQTAWNLEGRAQGHTDIPLDDTGQEQARRLAENWTLGEFFTLWSSDLKRASETAKALAQKLHANHEEHEWLREQNLGDCEGMLYADVRALMAQHKMPPGGESAEAQWQRIGEGIRKIEAHGEDLIIVSHGGTCSMLLAQLLKGAPETARSLTFGNTAICELWRRNDGVWRLLRYNDTSHLNLPSAPMVDAR